MDPQPDADPPIAGDLILPGIRDYAGAHQAQQRILEEVVAGARPDTLLLGSHPHTITLGRGGSANDILFKRDGGLPEGMTPPEVIETERGGEVTYHGPGQVVGYPIINLRERRDLHRYLRDLEEVLIRALAAVGLEAGREEGFTGVWVGPAGARRKIASIGVAVRKWVAWHGFALNVATDLRYFTLINPCGLEASVMTSVSRELGRDVQPEALHAPILAGFAAVFGIGFREDSGPDE